MGLKVDVGGWRDRPVVKSTDKSYRRPGFCSWHPHSKSQVTIISVLGDLILSSDVCRNQAKKRYTDTHASETLIHIK